MIDYQVRVARGIALLDEKVPGWVDMIDLDRLDVGDPQRCVVSQTAGLRKTSSGVVFGHFEDGLAKLGCVGGEFTLVQFASARGFMLDSADFMTEESAFLAETGAPGASIEEVYANLTAAWRKAVAALRSASQPSA